MKKNNKIIISLLSLFLLFNFTTIQANDFEANEDYYKQLCSNPETAQKNNSTCLSFNAYLNEKIESANAQINQYKGEMNKHKDDINKQMALAEEFQAKIDGFASEISALQGEIATLEASIKKIEAEIKAREEEIKKKDEIIIERMRKTQSDMRFGYEIDFLFKSIDFATLISSMTIVSDIMNFEAIQIQKINALIEEQKSSQQTLESNKTTIANNIKTIEINKQSTEVLKAEVDIVIANYQKMMADLAALQSQAFADAASVRRQVAANKKALEALPPSNGFTRPLAGGYLSAGVWAYPPNKLGLAAIHLGHDYAAPMGTSIRAAANGIIIASSDNCGSTGALGNWCGSSGGLAGGGNQVHMITSVNGKLYGIMYLHMQSGSPIAKGSVVTAGQTIGRVGSSGNSTGPHVHVEVLYLGTQNISDYVASWNGSLHHNVGMSLSRRCQDNGNTAPCRLNPGVVF